MITRKNDRLDQRGQTKCTIIVLEHFTAFYGVIYRLDAQDNTNKEVIFSR